MAAPSTHINLQDLGTNTRSRRDRPCDSCRRRKSRCVLPPGAEACVLCTFHKQTCTFGNASATAVRKRKRTSGDESAEVSGAGRLSQASRQQPPQQAAIESQTSTVAVHLLHSEDYPPHQTSALLRTTLGLQHHHHAELIGLTTAFEPFIFGATNEKTTYCRNGTLRVVAPATTFLIKPDSETQNHQHEIEALDAIEALVTPHGPALIDIYFRIVHPSFPILHKKVFLEKYARSHREFSPPCLAGVYILASGWWSYSAELASFPAPDVKALEKLASTTFNDVVYRPKLSTIQGGLLLSQHNSGESWTRTAQLIAVGQTLGLHLDCSDWDIPAWEKGLRKRLAWALFMQDTWSALIHGWPAKITSDNWMVQAVSEDDFPERGAEEEEDEQVKSEIDQGRIVFTQMIALSQIVSEILYNFYTLRAAKDLQDNLYPVLDRAKPIQFRLKGWHTALPDSLRMDNTKDQRLSSTSYLHLAYYATEITLHRCIIRSLCTTTSTIDPTLFRICRDAAKTRFLAVIGFIDTLRPEHLRAFWYFCSSTNLTLIAAFGSLLCATAADAEEVKYYEDLLGKYRWKLRVLQMGIMDGAVAMLDSTLALLKPLNAQRLTAGL